MRALLAFAILLSTTALNAAPRQSLPAFPEAQGGGAASVGGRGGTTILVTNLNDSGPGSLRACVESSGPRTCVFRTGGIIELQNSLYVEHPYLTIAGQTAPGGGIALSGRGTCKHLVFVATHDVVLRYLHVRHGAYNHDCGGLNVESDANNVVVDHSSISWSNGDDNAGLDGSRDPANNVMPNNQSWQWNLIAEPLSGQPTDLVSSCTTAGCDAMHDVDIHHNLLMSASYRMPLFKSKTSRFVSNIVYNSGRFYSAIVPGVSADFIDNKYVRGPLQVFSWGSYQPIHEVQLARACGDPHYCPSGTATIHMSGNIGPFQANPNGDQWQMTALLEGDINSPESQTPIPVANQRANALAVPYPYPIRADAAASLDDTLLPHVGASQRLGCDGAWVGNRDSADARLVDEYRTNNGVKSFPHSENDVGGYPVYAAGQPCAMTIPDGIPDEWKQAHGLPVGGPSRANEVDTNGYTFLENYLNGASAGTPPGGGGGGPPGGGGASLPDLIVTALSYDTKTHHFTSVVKNIGQAPTPNDVVIGNGFTVDDEDVTWGSVPGPLAPGASVTVTSEGGGPYTIPEGTHKIGVLANAYGCCGRFEEADRTNNSLSDEIVISPCPPARRAPH